MAEMNKDANYYYNRAMQARQHGNERLAQYMEQYAQQLDPALQAQRQDEYNMRKQRQEDLYNQYVARQEAARQAAARPVAPAEYNPYASVPVANNYNYGTGAGGNNDHEENAAPVGQPMGDEDQRGGGYIYADNQGQQFKDPVTGGDYDKTWNANTFSMQANGLPEKRFENSAWNKPISSWFQLDDSYGRQLAENYKKREYDNP